MSFGGGLPPAGPGGIIFAPYEQFDGDPRIAPGLPRKQGWRVLMPDGSAAYDKTGPADTDWCLVECGGDVGGVDQIVPGPGIGVSPGGGTGVVTVSNTGVLSLNGEVGGVTIGSSDGSLNVQTIGSTDIDLTIAGGSGVPLSVASVKTTSGTARKTILSSGDSLMAGNGGFQFSIVYWLVGAASLLKQPGGYLTTWQVRGGEKILATANTAVGGTTTADALTNVIPWLITPAPDGSDLFVNWGINDVIVAGLSPAASAANVTAILTAVFAARPNSRVHWISAIWGGGEQWGLNAQGVPEGINAFDPQIRATNAAIRAAVVAFINARYLDVYSDVYRISAANNLPAPGLATGFLTADGVHPGFSGANLIAQCIFARITAAGGLFTKPTLPPSQGDMVAGNWYDEARLFLSCGIVAQKGPPLVSFNRYEQVRLSSGVAALPAGVEDAFIDGGGLQFHVLASATPPALNFTPILYQAPKSTAWAIALDLYVLDEGEGGGSAFAGLVDQFGSPLFDAILFGYDPAVSTTNFILREVRGGVAHDTILSGGGGTTAIPFDHNRHCVMIFFDGGIGAGGLGIWDCYVDFQQAAHLNPSADFPQNPVALGAGYCSNQQRIAIGKALYMYNEPFTTPS
jgi:lysophospholipase L1-like esterase